MKLKGSESVKRIKKIIAGVLLCALVIGLMIPTLLCLTSALF